MDKEKAIKLFSTGNKYYFETHFEYRGHEYIVEYSSGYTTFSQKPAWLQHKEAQERIDRIVDNPTTPEPIAAGTFNSDDIYKLYGWD